MTRSLTDVDTVVAVCGMAEDPLVFLIKGFHGVPCERDSRLQLLCVRGELDMLPGSSRRAALAGANGVPGREPEIGMLRCVFSALQSVRRDVALWEVRHRIKARLEQQDGGITVGNAVYAETHTNCTG